MKRILPLLFSLYTGILSAQTFEIPAEDFPFYQAVEWKGLGAILINRDPSFNLRQVHLTTVAENPTSAWQQAFNPLGKEFYFIAEDGGKYAYFLNNFEFKDSKITFHQLTINGNVKSQSVSVLTILKRLGNFSLDDLVLTDIVTTEKALVYMLTNTDKATNKKTTIALTMTHHNLVPYAAIIAENISASSKIEDQVSWYVAGEKGESIIYAARTRAGKNAGWLVKQFTSKGEYESETTVQSAGLTFADHSRVGFGTRGSAFLKVVEPKEQGTLVYANGGYYVAGIELAGTTASLTSYVQNNNKWVKLVSTPVKNYTAKKTADVGFFPMKEGIGWFVGSGQGEGHFHPFSGAGIVSGMVTQQINNPSRLLTAEFTGKFVAALPGKWLVFDQSQLPAAGAVTFEYVNK